MQNKQFTHTAGIDISKKTLDVCLFDGQNATEHLKINNSARDVRMAFVRLFKKQGLDMKQVLVCAEHTGMYSYPLVQASQALGLNLWLENGAEIKLRSGVQRAKNDKVDALRIARYAFRYADSMELYRPVPEALQKLAELNSTRDLLVKDRAKYNTLLKEQEDFIAPSVHKQKSRCLKPFIKALEQSIAAIEAQMDEIIRTQPELQQQFAILTSMPGVGSQVAIQTLIATRGFTRFRDARKFCCHAGVAPFEQQSGSSLKKRSRVSHRANKRLKTLFHLAALSAIRLTGDLRTYYLRKVAEGKNKMTVLNAVRAKIIHRIFALIRDNRMYQINHPDNLVLS